MITHGLKTAGSLSALKAFSFLQILDPLPSEQRLVALKSKTRKPEGHRLPHKNSRKKVSQTPAEEQRIGKQAKQ